MQGQLRAFHALATLATITACGGHTRLNVGPVPPGVQVDASVRYYDVTAATLAELRRGMRLQGPSWEGRTWQAVTQSRFRWTYQYGRIGSSCSLRRVRVLVATVVTFPRWNATAPPDSVTLDWWQQLNAGLMEHERGHALLSVKTAGEIARTMEGMTHLDCASLGEQANRAGRRLIDLERRQQVEYDRTTRHGAIQIEQAGRLRDP
jgi:predicted secreted Zn-dependent protease